MIHLVICTKKRFVIPIFTLIERRRTYIHRTYTKHWRASQVYSSQSVRPGNLDHRWNIQNFKFLGKYTLFGSVSNSQGKDERGEVLKILYTVCACSLKQIQTSVGSATSIFSSPSVARWVCSNTLASDVCVCLTFWDVRLKMLSESSTQEDRQQW